MNQKLFVQNSYQDNTFIIDALNKSYKLLNDSCKTAKDDTKYLVKLKSEFNKQDIIALQFPKVDNGTFIINHTQNPVTYKVDGFNAKNIDELSQSIKDVILKSSNEYIPSIFKSDEVNQPNQGRFLGEKFSNQMKELMEELNSSDVHFVRCVKTNELKRKEHFLEGYVLQQIEYLGVLNSIEVRKSTYPQRRDYLSFFKEYKICDDALEKKPIQQIQNFQNECKYLIKKMFPQYDDKMVLFGNNKIYMKMEFESAIDQIKYAQIKLKKTAHATRIQIYYRYYKFHIKFQKRLQAVKNGTNHLVSKFYKQKIFSVYDHAFQQIQFRARMTVLKQFIQLHTKYIKKSYSKQILNVLIRNRIVKNEQIEQEKILMKQTEQQKLEQHKKQEEQQKLEKSKQQQEEIKKQEVNQMNIQLNVDSSTQNMTDQNQSSLFETISVNQTTEETRKNSSQLNNSTPKESDFNQQRLDQNLNNINALNFQTEDMTKINIPEKNSNEVYINPPNESEINDKLLILRLLKNEEVEDQKIKNLIPQPAIDKEYTLKDFEEENLKKIEQHNYIQFYSNNKSQRLNERRKFFGKKTTEEILTYKSERIKGGTLLQLPAQEVSPALIHFENLLLFMKETETIKYSLNQQYSTVSSQNDGQEQRIQSLLKYSLNNSQKFKNEVLTQILKQLNNNKNDLMTLRLLHYLVVFCFCYKTEEEFAMAMLNFLIFDLFKQWKASEIIRKYIQFIIPTILRSISYLVERESIYSKNILSELKIHALIFQYQIKVPITISNGTSFLIDVDPYDNFQNLKYKVMQFLNINTDRLVTDLFEFFEVQSQDNQIFQRLLFPLEGVWDITHQQDISRNKSEHQSKKQGQTQGKRQYQVMFQPMFLYTVYPNDEVGISLLQSQIYFDAYIANLIFEDSDLSIKMFAHLKNITQVEDISIILPLSYSDEESNSISQLVQKYYESYVKDQFNRIQSQFEYIQLAKNNPNVLGLKMLIKYCPGQGYMSQPQDLLMILNSQSMSFYKFDEKQNIQLTHWARQERFIVLKTNDGKSHTINTEYSLNIQYYICQITQLMKTQDKLYYESIANIYNSINTQKSQQKQTQLQLPANLKSKESLLQFQNLYKNA